MKAEDEVQGEIQTNAVKDHCILMRNNSGACRTEEGRHIRFGLGNISKDHNDRIKSSDLVGPTTIIVTQEMVGKPIAVFTAIEVKKEAWKFTGTKREVAQKAFIDWVIAVGGYAGFANSVDTFKKIIGR